jgi:hypothetical protein
MAQVIGESARAHPGKILNLREVDVLRFSGWLRLKSKETCYRTSAVHRLQLAVARNSPHNLTSMQCWVRALLILISTGTFVLPFNVSPVHHKGVAPCSRVSSRLSPRVRIQVFSLIVRLFVRAGCLCPMKSYDVGMRCRIMSWQCYGRYAWYDREMACA